MLQMSLSNGFDWHRININIFFIIEDLIGFKATAGQFSLRVHVPLLLLLEKNSSIVMYYITDWPGLQESECMNAFTTNNSPGSVR